MDILLILLATVATLLVAEVVLAPAARRAGAREVERALRTLAGRWVCLHFSDARGDQYGRLRAVGTHSLTLDWLHGGQVTHRLAPLDLVSVAVLANQAILDAEYAKHLAAPTGPAPPVIEAAAPTPHGPH